MSYSISVVKYFLNIISFTLDNRTFVCYYNSVAITFKELIDND